MTDMHIRHLPVVDDEKVVGMLSIGDLVKAVIDEQAAGARAVATIHRGKSGALPEGDNRNGRPAAISGSRLTFDPHQLSYTGMSLDPALRARLHRLLADYGAKVRSLIDGHGLGQYGIDPADIEQEVRIRLWKALERDRNAAFHTSFIQRVVLTVVIDAIRAANARPVEALPDDGLDDAGTAFIDPTARA